MSKLTEFRLPVLYLNVAHAARSNSVVRAQRVSFRDGRMQIGLVRNIRKRLNE